MQLNEMTDKEIEIGLPKNEFLNRAMVDLVETIQIAIEHGRDENIMRDSYEVAALILEAIYIKGRYDNKIGSKE